MNYRMPSDSMTNVLPRERGVVRAEGLMARAIEIARSTSKGDIPVGAVVYGPDGAELAWGTNRREADQDPTAHAEILAIRQAAKVYGDGWRLSQCTLVVTLEPCTMCAGALLGARVGELIFGAYEPKMGACGSLIDAVRAPGQLHRPAVRGGVLEGECSRLLSDFFGALR